MPTPTEAYPTDATIDALTGTTNPTTGLAYVALNTGPTSSPPAIRQFDRLTHRLSLQLTPLASCRVVKEVISGLTYGIHPGDYRQGGTIKTYAGVTAQSATNNATTYAWIDSSNTLATSTSAFPADATSHFRLAEIVASGGDITSITDRRPTAIFTVPTATSTSDTGTNEVSYIIDEDNAGAAAATLSIRMNRGSSNSEDAALAWIEANGWLEARSRHSTGTLCPINCSQVSISGTSALDSNGAAKVQSAVAGNGLQHASGVLSVKTGSAQGTAISGTTVAVDPSDGVTLDANGVAIALTSNAGLQFTGSAGSGTLGVKPDNATIENDSGGVRVKDGGLAPVKTANHSASAGAIPVYFTATLTGGNTVSIFTANAPYKFRVLHVHSIALSADGGTWKVDDGTNAITDTVTVTGVDKTVNRCSTIDDAEWDIAASGSLRVVGDGANADAFVIIECMRVA